MENKFHWADYLVFGLMLVISTAIGIVFGILDRKKKTTNDFLLGGGDLKVILKCFSLFFFWIIY